jgi:flagellar hook-associated protein 2
MIVAGGTTGARGSVAVSRGFADQLDRTLTSFLSTTGVIAARTDGANQSLTALGKREDAEQTRLNKVQAAYYKQYQALDAMMSSMTATSTYLTQQIAAMTKTTA